MERKDYLMRYIEQLGKVLAALLGFREKGDSKGGLLVIDEALKDMTSMDSSELNAIPEDRFISDVTVSRNLLPAQVKCIAELLFQEAEFYGLEDMAEEAMQRYRKAYLLLQYIDETEKTYSEERIDRMHFLENRISQDR